MKCYGQLLEADLWLRFHSQTNEMIITKAGRCLFPLLCVEFSEMAGGVGTTSLLVDIDTMAKYDVEVEIVSQDTHKWKYRHGQWIALLTGHTFGTGEIGFPRSDRISARQSIVSQPSHIITYARGVLGADLLREGLNLERLKLSNRPNGNFTLQLQSFHRYIPIIHLCFGNPTTASASATASISNSTTFRRQTLCFPETEFIAVTHYQNEAITLLKKSYNPHAKGFVISQPAMEVTFDDYDEEDDDEEEQAHVQSHLVQQEMETHGSSVPSIGKRLRRRVRRRIRPLQDILTPEPSQLPSSLTAFPSDDEELQGGLDLQFLASGKGD